MAVQKIFTASLVGIDAALIEVEADVSNGLPTVIIVGLPNTAVQESRERVRSAIKHSGLTFPLGRVSLNLAPAELPKAGTHFDLPIALAIILASREKLPKPRDLSKFLFAGELSLDGQIKPVPGVLAMAIAAQTAGLQAVFVPKENAPIAALVSDIEVYPVETLAELIHRLLGTKESQAKILKCLRKDKVFDNPDAAESSDSITLSDIAGQQHAKRALEVAAAGNHNILFTGPPGSGKTMLAKALPSIMPRLTQSEILELTKIHNSVSRFSSGVINFRPFRNPHHTTSSVALIGGGSVPRPGEITLAHRGVLFLDELPEFPRAVLEVLRQPLEENTITITRAKHSFRFPASFTLVAAQNPCPCGNFGQVMNNVKLECSCSPAVIQKYHKRVSGPLLDRIDLHITVPRLSYQQLNGQMPSENSLTIRNRVEQARTIQTKRFNKVMTNSEMSGANVKKFCQLNLDASQLLETAADRYQLSARAIHRILKVARTIADLANSEKISIDHLAESLQFRLRQEA